MPRITDADLAFVARFLPAFLAGQPSNGPFSYLHDLKPARVSIDAPDDGIELGDYSIRVLDHPSRTQGFGDLKRPAEQYELTVAWVTHSSRRDEPDDVNIEVIGHADTLVDVLALMLAGQVQGHVNAMLESWREAEQTEGA